MEEKVQIIFIDTKKVNFYGKTVSLDVRNVVKIKCCCNRDTVYLMSYIKYAQIIQVS